VRMRAAVYLGGSHGLQVVDDVELEDPHRGEVVVDVQACGVCHSDLSVLDGTFPAPTPIIMGHEAAGIVAEVGEGVVGLESGDHVVLTPSAACGSCYGCVRGEYGTCVNADALWSFAMPDGSTRLSRAGETVHRGLGLAAFADRVVALESAAVRIDPDIPLDVACTIGCGVQTGVGAVINTAQVEPGASVLVMGLGGVGLSVIQGAAMAGASTIIGVDLVPERRAAAATMGATDVVDPAAVDLSAIVAEITGGVGVDYAFEVVGRSELIRTCIEVCRAGGTTVMVGAPPLDDPLIIDAPVLFGVAEKKLIGCMLGSVNSRRDIPKLISLWQSGRLDLEGLVTARRPFDEIAEALDALADHQGIRTVLTY
jgi:S-(hydroxymethyl)glutathione dehydrogenase/alcohol dehydrogenase